MKQHAIWIDILKGVAIILVVVGHNATQNITDFIFICRCFSCFLDLHSLLNR